MSVVLRGSSWVMVQVQGYPPAKMLLTQVRAGLQSSQLPPTAVVQAGPNEPWRSASEVIAECADFQPTLAGGAIAVLVAVPLAWLVLHLVLFGTHGVVGPAVVVAVGFIGAIVVAGSSLRTRTPRQLFNVGAFSAIVGIVFLLGDGVGLGYGVSSRLKASTISTAIAASDPCAVENVPEADVKEYVAEDEQQKFFERVGACRTVQQDQSCARALSALDRKSASENDYVVVGETHQAETTHAVLLRIVQGKLTVADLATEKSDLECGEGMWTRLIATLAASPTVWTTPASDVPVPRDEQLFKLSADVQSSLSTHGLADPIKNALRARTERFAKAALSKPDELDDAKAECDQLVELKVDVGQSCKAVAKRHSALEANEQAHDEANEKKEGALFVSCMTACNGGRSPQQAEADNALAAACSERCGSDVGCLTSCRGGASTCELNCARKYPGAASGP